MECLLTPYRFKMEERMGDTIFEIISRAILMGLLFCYSILADDSITSTVKNDNGKKPVIIEDIFKDIMLTLPLEMKADVDSVKKNQTNTTNSKSTDVSHGGKITTHIQQDDRYNKLPLKVQQQVEKTIMELEKNREERELQFKKIKKKKDQ